ncbi:MAG: RNA methyltransferase [Hyphomicrobiales bacterium]|nr:RNA methyltransferase [Hyphomicrobiales bacterium]
MKTERKIAGHIKQVTSVSNPIIKAIKGLQLKKNRDSDGLFVAEGLKLITDAIDNGWEISTLIYAKNIANQPHLQNIAVKSRANGTNLLEVSEKVLGSITRRDNPQLAVGVFRQKTTELSSVRAGDVDLWIGLDRVRDPGNLGTIIRTADCVGAKGVMLIGETTDPWSLEAVRATMGSIFNIVLVQCSQDEFLSWRGGWTGLVVATHLEGSTDYRAIDYDNKPVLVLMGNEQQGLPDNLVDICTHKALIPMAGQADSLNLAIATGIMVFEVKRSMLKIAGNKDGSGSDESH